MRANKNLAFTCCEKIVCKFGNRYTIIGTLFENRYSDTQLYILISDIPF